jgi:hypothetical protein
MFSVSVNLDSREPQTLCFDDAKKVETRQKYNSWPVLVLSPIPSQLLQTSSPLRYVASRSSSVSFKAIWSTSMDDWLMSVKGMAHLFLWRRRRVNEHDLSLARWSLWGSEPLANYAESSQVTRLSMWACQCKQGRKLETNYYYYYLSLCENYNNHFFHSI